MMRSQLRNASKERRIRKAFLAASFAIPLVTSLSGLMQAQVPGNYAPPRNQPARNIPVQGATYAKPSPASYNQPLPVMPSQMMPVQQTPVQPMQGQAVPEGAIPGAATLQGPTWVTVGQIQGNGGCASCGNAGGVCAQCARTDIPAPVQVAPGPQPIGLTSGCCQPCITGIDCADSGGRELRWNEARSLNFQPLQHGEFVGPIRIPATIQYRVRIGDEISFVYYMARQPGGTDYKLQVGDEVTISSITDNTIRVGDQTKGATIQPDGKIHLQMIGAIPAAGRTIPQLRSDLNKAYAQLLKNPAIDVQPVKTNTKLLDLKETVSSRFSNGGLEQSRIVNPDGRITLPSIDPFYVYGMTLDEIRREVNLRYSQQFEGLEIQPSVLRQAPKFAYVYGEVGKAGKFELTGPTSVSQLLAMAENIKSTGNQREIVVFRRAEDWRLISTKLDLRAAHLGRRPNPADEIWIRDNDLVIVSPTPMKVFDNVVDQVFTQGLYRVVPFGGISIQQQN